MVFSMKQTIQRAWGYPHDYGPPHMFPHTPHILPIYGSFRLAVPVAQVGGVAGEAGLIPKPFGSHHALSLGVTRDGMGM